jgi:hypothetical protein
MRVSGEPVCIYLFWQNPVFTSLYLRSPVHVVPPLCYAISHLFRGTVWLPSIPSKINELTIDFPIFVKKYYSADYERRRNWRLFRRNSACFAEQKALGILLRFVLWNKMSLILFRETKWKKISCLAKCLFRDITKFLFASISRKSFGTKFRWKQLFFGRHNKVTHGLVPRGGNATPLPALATWGR